MERRNFVKGAVATLAGLTGAKAVDAAAAPVTDLPAVPVVEAAQERLSDVAVREGIKPLERGWTMFRNAWGGPGDLPFAVDVGPIPPQYAWAHAPMQGMEIQRRLDMENPYQRMWQQALEMQDRRRDRSLERMLDRVVDALDASEKKYQQLDATLQALVSRVSGMDTKLDCQSHELRNLPNEVWNMPMTGVTQYDSYGQPILNNNELSKKLDELLRHVGVNVSAGDMIDGYSPTLKDELTYAISDVRAKVDSLEAKSDAHGARMDDADIIARFTAERLEMESVIRRFVDVNKYRPNLIQISEGMYGHVLYWPIVIGNSLAEREAFVAKHFWDWYGLHVQVSKTASDKYVVMYNAALFKPEKGQRDDLRAYPSETGFHPTVERSPKIGELVRRDDGSVVGIALGEVREDGSLPVMTGCVAFNGPVGPTGWQGPVGCTGEPSVPTISHTSSCAELERQSIAYAKFVAGLQMSERLERLKQLKGRNEPFHALVQYQLGKPEYSAGSYVVAYYTSDVLARRATFVLALEEAKAKLPRAPMLVEMNSVDVKEALKWLKSDFSGCRPSLSEKEWDAAWEQAAKKAFQQEFGLNLTLIARVEGKLVPGVRFIG